MGKFVGIKIINSKEILRKAGRLGDVDPKELETFEEWVEYLESILTGPYAMFPDQKTGELILLTVKARIDTVRGMKIEIYPNEHTPPHFHVKSPNIDVTIRIKDCSVIEGNISQRDFEKILYWYRAGSKKHLIEKWNDLRPTNCVVGKYSE